MYFSVVFLLSLLGLVSFSVQCQVGLRFDFIRPCNLEQNEALEERGFHGLRGVWKSWDILKRRNKPRVQYNSMVPNTFKKLLTTEFSCECQINTDLEFQNRRISTSEYPFILILAINVGDEIQDIGYGTLISKKHLVLAQRCLLRVTDIRSLLVYDSDSEIVHSPSPFKGVTSIKYNERFQLSLLKIKVADWFARPICMPPKNFDPIGVPGYISSFKPTELASVILKETSGRSDNHLWLEARRISRNGLMVCAAKLGGPVFYKCYDENRYFLLGFSIHEEHSCIYANVLSEEIRNWIARVVGEKNMCRSQRCLYEKPVLVHEEIDVAVPCSKWECGISSKFVEGNEEIEFYPWIVSVEKDGDQLCFGTLITLKNIIVTFGIVNSNKDSDDLDSFLVRLGNPAFTASKSYSDSKKISDVVHSLKVGLSLLTLIDFVNVDNDARPVCMPPQDYDSSRKSAKIAIWNNGNEEAGQTTVDAVLENHVITTKTGRQLIRIKARTTHRLSKLNGGAAFHKIENQNKYFLLGVAKSNKEDNDEYLPVTSTEVQTWLEKYVGVGSMRRAP